MILRNFTIVQIAEYYIVYDSSMKTFMPYLFFVVKEFSQIYARCKKRLSLASFEMKFSWNGKLREKSHSSTSSQTNSRYGYKLEARKVIVKGPRRRIFPSLSACLYSYDCGATGDISMDESIHKALKGKVACALCANNAAIKNKISCYASTVES